MLRKLHSERERIRALIKLSEGIPMDNLLLRSEWTKYLSIRIVGYLEQAIKTIFVEYVGSKAHPNIGRYAKARLQDFKNPSTAGIENILRSFNPNWADDLNAFWDGERKDAVDSLLNTRNHIAHGMDFGTTFSNIVKYYDHLDKVIIFIHNRVLED